MLHFYKIILTSIKNKPMTKNSCRKRRNYCDNNCYDPCYTRCFPCPIYPPPPPPSVTNIAVLGTGPNGPNVTVGFTVVNTTTTPAAGVSVSISANQLGVLPGDIATTIGVASNTPGTSFILWTVGTLLGGQAASITFNQVGVGASPNTWTAVGATSTPEVSLIDNTATVFVPFPG